MNAKTTTTLTLADLHAGLTRDDFLGFGYLGTSQHSSVKMREQMDKTVLAHANNEGWTAEELFYWANSSYGRHAANALSDGKISDMMTRYFDAVRWNLMQLPTN